jgi:hypothetical protein
MLMIFFSVVYYVVLLFLIDLVFRNTLSLYTDLLALICMIIAFIVSVGMAEYTVKKIKDK